MFDYHVHTKRSIDCDTPVADSCEAAIAAGVTEIAFTDHVDFEISDEGYGYYEYDAYQEDIDRAQQTYSDRLTILRGAEIDFNTGTRNDVAEWMEDHTKYDFIIGSVHYLESGGFHFPGFFDNVSIDDVFNAYYEQLCAAAETGWFDTIGHIDLPKRYAPESSGVYDPMKYEDQVRNLFEILIQKNLSFEINTSGIRQGPKTSMPAGQLVALFVSMGGRLITVGSDSHFASHIGSGLEKTLAMLQLCGIDEVSSFRNRVRTQVPITSLIAS